MYRYLDIRIIQSNKEIVGWEVLNSNFRDLEPKGQMRRFDVAAVLVEWSGALALAVRCTVGNG